MPDSQLNDITHTIQSAVAPVFLLSALGTTLLVLANRLARIIDRARLLEDRLVGGEDAQARAELAVLSQRARLIHRGLTSAVGSALSVCVLITVAFVGYLSQTRLGHLVAVLFIIAMDLFVYALTNFLRETFLAIHSLSFGQRGVKLPAISGA